MVPGPVFLDPSTRRVKTCNAGISFVFRLGSTQQCSILHYSVSWVSHVRLCVWDHESQIGTRTPACDWTRIPAISIAIAGVVGKLSGWCSVAEQLWALIDILSTVYLHCTAPCHEKDRSEKFD